jgi:hypothetical protein
MVTWDQATKDSKRDTTSNHPLAERVFEFILTVLCSQNYVLMEMGKALKVKRT